MTQITSIAEVVWLEMLRKKDFYVLLVLLALMLGALLSMRVFDLSDVVEFVKGIGLLITWVMTWILAVNFSTRQLPDEETKGTIFTLLAKPVARWKVVVGKWLGVWLAVAFATLCFYALLVVVVMLRGGSFDIWLLLQAYVLHAIGLGVITAIGICISTRMHYDAAAAMTYALTAACYAVVPYMASLAVSTPGWRHFVLAALYFTLPHLDLFDLRQRLTFSDWVPMQTYVPWAIAAYGLCLIVIFLILAWLAYRNKRFTRGAML